MENPCKKVLIYDNPLASQEDVKAFRLEGSAKVSYLNGKMRLENQMDENEGQKANFVYWCDRTFPPDIQIDWEFRPLREPGLCILFFAAMGRKGEDIFDAGLNPRLGEYESYHHGDINTYHISYFRRRWEDERAFHTCNLRKSYGFSLVCSGADPIPSVEDVAAPYHMRVVKFHNEISLLIDDLLIFRWKDEGGTPALGKGKIGFRQMAPLCAEYSNFTVSELV